MGATRLASGHFSAASRRVGNEMKKRPAFIGEGAKKDMHFYLNTAQSLLPSG